MKNLRINVSDSITQLAQIGSNDRQFNFLTFDDSPSNRPELTKKFCGTLEENKDELERLNRQGAGIFFLVNISKSEKTTKDQIIGRVAHFADGDDGPIQNMDLEPTMVIQTANGQHAYWVLDKTESIDGFERLQKAISTKLSTDTLVSNSNRLMRLAGFYHQKDPANPVLVKVTKSNGPKYSLTAIEKHFAVEKRDSQFCTNRQGIGNKWAEGTRNSSLYKFMKNVEALLPSGATEDDYFKIATTINQTCAVEPLPDAEIEKFSKSKYKEFIENKIDTPEIMTFEELEKIEYKPKEWIVENFIFKRQISIIAARPKAGKSTLMRYMAGCVADAKEFIGRKTKSSKVLYVAMEELLEDVQADFKDMSIINKHLIRAGGLPFNENQLDVLKSLIEKYSPDLIFLDTLVHVTGVKDMNDYVETSINFKKFRTLAENYNCHIALVHHSRKSEGNGNSTILGSTGIAGAVDLIMDLKKDEDGNSFFKSEGRSSQIHFEETPLSFHFKSKSFIINGDYHLNECDEYLELIKKYPGLTRLEIQEKMKKKSQSVSDNLKLLMNQELIRKDGKKFYVKYSVGGPNELY